MTHSRGAWLPIPFNCRISANGRIRKNASRGAGRGRANADGSRALVYLGGADRRSADFTDFTDLPPTAAWVDQRGSAGRNRARPCENLVTIGGADAGAPLLQGFFGGWVRVQHPQRLCGARPEGGWQASCSMAATGYGGIEARAGGGGEGPAWGSRTYRWIKRG